MATVKPTEHFIMSFGPNLHVEEEEEDSYNQCHDGHFLMLHFTAMDGFTCDVCEKSFARNSLMYGCQECDFDKCEACYTQKIHKGTRWMSEYDKIENFNKALSSGRESVIDDNISESTSAGSADCSTPRFSLPSNSDEEFWHFYRGADSLASMSRSMPYLETSGLQEEIKPIVKESSPIVQESLPGIDYWKLPLAPLPDEEDAALTKPEETPQPQVRTSSKLRKKVGIAKFFGRASLCMGFQTESKPNAQHTNQNFRELAEQIYYNGWD
jgi:hypothetical protein